MKCMDAGTLQAYLDGELPEAQICSAAGHLESCAVCRDRVGRLEATMGRVTAWLDALSPEDLRIAARTTGVRWRWAGVALAGALAASVAVFFANARPQPEPVRAARKAANPRPMQAAAKQPMRAAVRPRPARVPRPKPRPAVDDFVAFDDADPMQMGMVVRVMLPVSGTQEIAADLVIGEDGRARAIRFVQ